MADVIPQINIDDTKVKNTWVQGEIVTNEVYNAINKAVKDLISNNNILDTNSMLFREQYNSSYKDLNNAIHQGVYSFNSSALNIPSGVSSGNLLVVNTSKKNQGAEIIITQIAFCNNGYIYNRFKNGTENFSNWYFLSSLDNTLDKTYPIGSIYMSTKPTDPSTIFGGKWKSMPAGRVLLAQGESDWGTTYNAGSDGGEATHKLIPTELAEHKHTAISSTVNIYGQVLVGVSNAQMATFGHSGVITPVSTYPELYVPNNATRPTVPGGAVINANVTPTITVNNTGGNQPHNNMQPYISVYMWERIG